MNEQNRAWPFLSPEAFKKIQDLEAVVAHNKETITALGESIRIHSTGLDMLIGEEVEPIREQFNYIINKFNESQANLVKFNEDAEAFLGYLSVTQDQETLNKFEAILKIVAFK